MIPVIPFMELLMKSGVSNMLSVLLLLHAAVGCRWQRTESNCDSTCIASIACKRCCSCTQAEDGCEQPKSSPCKCQFRCRGFCKYVPSRKVRVESDDCVRCTDVLIDGNCSFSRMLGCLSPGWLETHSPSSRPPLDLQLRNQVFRI